MNRFCLSCVLALFSTMVLVACGEKEIEVSSVAISQPSAEMEIGETLSLKATVSPSNASHDGITWTSTKPKVASVSNSGLVSAISEGSTTITVMAGGKTASCSITVVKGFVAVSGISLNKTSLELIEGDTETLSATVLPENATDKTVTWSSSKNDIATVKDGVVSAISEGEATITAKASDKTAICTVHVSKKIIAVSSISLSKETLELVEGASESITATVLPENATDKTVTWSSSNCDVAEVDETGIVYARHEGQAIIEAKAGDIIAKCNVIVSAPDYVITFSDEIVKRVCVSRYDKNNDGEVSSREVSDITYIPSNFFGEYSRAVQSFEELKYFTALTDIPSNAFNDCSYLTKVTLPDGIVRIGQFAFANCRALKEMDLPDGISSIQKSAFLNCALLDITIPSHCYSIGESAFSGSGITSASIPDGLSSIAISLFASCKKLTTVKLPSSVTRIERSAFSGCNNLTDINLPNSLTSIGEWAFVSSGIRSLTLPESLVTISNSCFARTSIVDLVIPRSIVSIQEGAFAECNELKSLTIENENTIFDGNPFSKCRNLQMILGPLASSDNRLLVKDNVAITLACGGISEYSFPSGITRIGKRMAEECPLTKVVIPGSVEIIDDYAFWSDFTYNGSQLVNVVLTKGLKTIGQSAFSSCRFLEEIEIPETVEAIWSYAFQNCLSLKTIVVRPSIPPVINNEVFKYSTCPIFVPEESLNLYKSADGWSDYADRIQSNTD